MVLTSFKWLFWLLMLLIVNKIAYNILKNQLKILFKYDIIISSFKIAIFKEIKQFGDNIF